MIAVCVDPAHVEKVWPLVSHHILAAMKRGDCGSFSATQDDVLAGRALLWLAVTEPQIEGAAVTQVDETETGRVCWIVACGGTRLDRWVGCLDAIEAYAKTMNCKAVRLMGRRGWERVLKNYRATKVILEKAL